MIYYGTATAAMQLIILTYFNQNEKYKCIHIYICMYIYVFYLHKYLKSIYPYMLHKSFIAKHCEGKIPEPGGPFTESDEVSMKEV